MSPLVIYDEESNNITNQLQTLRQELTKIDNKICSTSTLHLSSFVAFFPIWVVARAADVEV
jgi:hypothetical protein